jgi:hypothetical protein
MLISISSLTKEINHGTPYIGKRDLFHRRWSLRENLKFPFPISHIYSYDMGNFTHLFQWQQMGLARRFFLPKTRFSRAREK